MNSMEQSSTCCPKCWHVPGQAEHEADIYNGYCFNPQCPCHKSSPQEGWRERLQYEVLEDYLRCAEGRYMRKDGIAKYMEEMRSHFEVLKSFIAAEIETALKDKLSSLIREVDGLKIKKVPYPDDYKGVNSWTKMMEEGRLRNDTLDDVLTILKREL